MYYTNITNEELQYFHNLKVPNFSITLTDLLASDLFEVETIITGSVYRVYPLFYTGRITSTNSNDRIIENKCIICQQNTNETVFTFISDETQPVTDYSLYTDVYSIGDNLTQNEFNNIIRLLRTNNVHTDNFNIKQGTVNGEYADYIFDIDSTTLTDKGILITDETLTNLGTVKLTNPVFNNSQYTLKLNVYHITDVNSFDNGSDNVVVDTLTIVLEKDVEINIPFNTLDYNYVIGFSAVVEITHNLPVIHGSWLANLLLNASSDIVMKNETILLTCTAIDNNGEPMPNVTVEFYKYVED